MRVLVVSIKILKIILYKLILGVIVNIFLKVYLWDDIY